MLEADREKMAVDVQPSLELDALLLVADFAKWDYKAMDGKKAKSLEQYELVAAG